MLNISVCSNETGHSLTPLQLPELSTQMQAALVDMRRGAGQGEDGEQDGQDGGAGNDDGWVDTGEDDLDQAGLVVAEMNI